MTLPTQTRLPTQTTPTVKSLVVSVAPLRLQLATQALRALTSFVQEAVGARKEEGRRKKGGESGVSASEFHPSVLRLGIATIAGMDPDSVCVETSRDAREGRVGEVAGGDAEVAVSGRASGAGVAECDADVGAGGGRHGLFAPPVMAAEAHSDSEEAK